MKNISGRMIVALLLSPISLASLAETSVPDSPHHLSGTLTLASDYMFKGMTQTWGGPALQGSIDYAHDAGITASFWTSTVSKKSYAGSNQEIDLSVGYKKTLDKDWFVGTGLLGVFYPGGNYKKVKYASMPSQRYDFAEANVSTGWRWASMRYSRTLTDLLGFNEKTGYTGSTNGSSYIEINADIPLDESFLLNLHAGHQHVTAKLATPTAGGSTNPDFEDYRIGATYLFPKEFSTTLAVVWNSNRTFYDATPSNNDLNDTRDIGKPRIVLSVMKNF